MSIIYSIGSERYSDFARKLSESGLGISEEGRDNVRKIFIAGFPSRIVGSYSCMGGELTIFGDEEVTIRDRAGPQVLETIVKNLDSQTYYVPEF